MCRNAACDDYLLGGQRHLHGVRDLSHHGQSSLVAPSSYLLRVAGPKLSRFSGLGRFRHTDFTIDFSLGVGSGGSGSLGG